MAGFAYLRSLLSRLGRTIASRVILAIWAAVSIISVTISLLVFMSGSTRSAFLLAIYRKIALVSPPGYAFVGDSLTAQCDWRLQLMKNPFGVINLASGGAAIRAVVSQVSQADSIGAEYVLIAAGLNDVILDDAPIDQIERDFGYLLRKIGAKKAIVTLIPYVSDAAFSERISGANRSIAILARQRGYPVIDLNPELAPEGVRKPEMTTDGVHFTPLACSIWLRAIRRQIAAQNAS